MRSQREGHAGGAGWEGTELGAGGVATDAGRAGTAVRPTSGSTATSPFSEPPSNAPSPTVITDDLRFVDEPVWAGVPGITSTYWALLALAAAVTVAGLLVGGTTVDGESPYATPPSVFVQTD